MENAVETRGLSFAYGPEAVVRGLDLAVPSGVVYGFVGPNGAGKTTTIRLLLGLLAPASGSVRVLGLPVPERREDVLRQVGALVEAPALYPHLTAEENLRLEALARDLPAVAVDRALEEAGLAGAGKKLVRELSLGMRQRLGLALAVIHRPRLLVLDEPANGLDPAGVRELRETLRRVASEDGVTVVVSSHILDELESVAEWIGVIARGTLRFQGPLDELKARQRAVLEVGADDPARARSVLEARGLAVAERPGGRLAVSVPGRSEIARLNALLVGAGVAVFHLGLEEASLERAFLDLVGPDGLGGAA